MGSRLLFLRGWVREGPGFLRGARVHGRTAAAALGGGISVSRGARVSYGCESSRLSAGVQHADEVGPSAAELALSVRAAAVRRPSHSQSTWIHARSCALFAMASHKSSSWFPFANVGNGREAPKSPASRYP